MFGVQFLEILVLYIDYYIMFMKVREKFSVSKQGRSFIKEMFNMGMLKIVENGI